MSLVGGSVRRPIGTIVVFLAIVLLGVVSTRELAIDLMPEVDMPRITVTTAYEGVAPQDIETLLTRPIEQAVSTVDGVDRIESTSTEGLSRVQLQFAWGMDLDAVVSDVRAQLERIRAELPEEADPPNVLKFDLSSASIAHLGLSGSGDARRLRYLAEEDLTRRLEAIPGIAKVDPRGGRRREIRIELARERLTALSISVSDVSAALARENRDVSAGDMLASGQEVVIRTRGEFQAVEEIGDTIVAQRQGRPIALRELGRVEDGVQEVRDQLWVDDVPGIRLIVSKQSDANTMEVVKDLRAEIDAINHDYEGRAHLTILRDSGLFIEQAVAGVRDAALLGGGLAVLVLFAFLREWRTTLVVASTIPVSVLATLALMHFLGITLNLVSFGGLALGVGMLVDNAIVIVESIHSKREAGLGAVDAAIVGTREVASAVVAGTLTTVAVFAPVVFLGGFTGIFFRQMALVVCFALGSSLAVALTLVPSVSALILRKPLHVHTSDGVRQGLLERAYGGVLRATLRRPRLLVAVAALLVASSGLLVDRLPTELMPQTDEGRIGISVELPAGTPLTETAATMQQVADTVRGVLTEGELEHIVAVAGPESWWKPAGSNKGSLDVLLVDKGRRQRGQDEIIVAIREALGDLPGADIRVTPESGNLLLRVMRGGKEDRLVIQVIGHDPLVAEQLADALRARAAEVPGVVYARLDRERGQLERTLLVDRARLGDLGLGASEVADTIEHYVLGRVATRLRDGGEEYDMRVVLREEDRERLEQLADLPIAIPGGGAVPLGQVARIEKSVGPASLAREDQERVLGVGIGIAERDLGSVASDLEAIVGDVAVPEGFEVRLGGEFREQQETFSRLLLGGILALFLVYAAMAVQFESLRDPLIVMSSVPFALVGVVAILLATGTSMNMQSALGVIVLVGIVVNNAIVLIDRINQLREDHGLGLGSAVVQGATARLRPVLMTTLTTLLGLVPLALGLGEGSELQAPLGRAVVGGLTTSTLVTLLVVPALYLLSHRAGAARRAREQNASA